MVIDLILAIFLGVLSESFLIFFIVLVLGALMGNPERPFSSGVLKFALMAMGISLLMSIFGGGSDLDL